MPERMPSLHFEDVDPEAQDRAIEVAFGQGGEVEMLTDEELKKGIHGLGAILRFTI